LLSGYIGLPNISLLTLDCNARLPVSQEIPLEHLGDIKTASIAEWVSVDAVRRAIQRHFKSFLMTYVDAHGQSVYGQRIKHLGEGESQPFP
jgi:hypothetical protein